MRKLVIRNDCTTHTARVAAYTYVFGVQTLRVLRTKAKYKKPNDAAAATLLIIPTNVALFGGRKNGDHIAFDDACFVVVVVVGIFLRSSRHSSLVER